MRRLEIGTLLVMGALAGCMTGAPSPRPGSPGGPASRCVGRATPAAPDADRPRRRMVLDRTDLALGTTVEFHHLPNVVELQDASRAVRCSVTW